MKKTLLLTFFVCLCSLTAALLLPAKAYAVDCLVNRLSITATLQEGKATKEEGGITYFPPDTTFMLEGNVDPGSISECGTGVEYSALSVSLDTEGEPGKTTLISESAGDFSSGFSGSINLSTGNYCVSVQAGYGASPVTLFDATHPALVEPDTGIDIFPTTLDEIPTRVLVSCPRGASFEIHIRAIDDDLEGETYFSERLFACGNTIPVELYEDASTGEKLTCPQNYRCCPSFCPATLIEADSILLPDNSLLTKGASWVCGYDGSQNVSPKPSPPPPLQPCQTVAGKLPENCNTALGLISSDAGGFVQSILGILLSVSGMLALYFIIRSGYQLMMSRGNPEKIGEAKERLTSAIVGLLLIIFSLVILSVIGVNLLKIPGFG